ncbi:hypothetical protein BDZ91DRAFT_768541 [Kalaharituber pfeilii]|nr:hypothetical protein BDZ91DRAFT_768541 [Kalaharituber pfeilii]
MAGTLLDVWDNFENVPEGLGNTDLTLVDQSRALIRSTASPKEWKDCVTVFPGTGRYAYAKCNRKREKKMIGNTNSPIPLDQCTDSGSAQLNQGYDESTLAYINKVEDLGVDYHSKQLSLNGNVLLPILLLRIGLLLLVIFLLRAAGVMLWILRKFLQKMKLTSIFFFLVSVTVPPVQLSRGQLGMMHSGFWRMLLLNTKEMEDWIVLEGVGACQPMEPLVPQLANLYDARRIGTYDPDAGYHTLPPISEHLESVRRDLDSVELQKFVAEELRCFENGDLKILDVLNANLEFLPQ